MKYIIRAPILIIIFYKIILADFFMIGSYDCYRLHQGDSCFLNTTRIDWNSDTTVFNDLFNTATTLGMKIMLIWARKPGTSYSHNITHFSGGQYSIYEAESTYFSHELGHNVGKAWVACTTKTGWLQQGPWTDEQYQHRADNLWYNAYFRLKSNDTSKTNPICTLFVRKATDNDTVIKAKRAITGKDFSSIGIYKEFLVSFMMNKYESGKLSYAIWYTGTNDSLYIDKVEVRDVVADSLKKGYYSDIIENIALYFNPMPAMFRYYLWDEPKPNQFWASGRVNQLLKAQDESKTGTQPVNIEFYDTYLNFVDISEVFINVYPFMGRTCQWRCGRTPIDSGTVFQQRLDYLWWRLRKARYFAKLHKKNLWYIPQAFGHALTDRTYYWNEEWNNRIPYEDEGWYREPSPREMRCMVWLALACGAKGICYFLYQSRTEDFILPDYKYQDYHWMAGLTSPKIADHFKRALWYTVQSINQELRSLGDLLLTLESDTVFKSIRIPGLNCFITRVSDSLMQVGTFHDNTSDYFIIVNRHCLPTDTISVTVGIKNMRYTVTYLYDCLTKEKITASESEDDIAEFVIQLLPGQGRLFKLLTEL